MGQILMAMGVVALFGIAYETWSAVCKMYFDIGIGSKKSYLQWFPFSKLSDEDEELICSKEFFNKYIASGTFVLFPEAMHRSENYIQKGDGSFRDSSLLSPILFLLLQAIGKKISHFYSQGRSGKIDVYYAGSFPSMRPNYKQDYDDFYKVINSYIDGCQFFIKTDITSFFSNINLDILIDAIDARCNSGASNISPTQLKLCKELLSYCGAGKFPLVENSIASSFFATIVYLDRIDERIFSFITEKITAFESFKMVRYVDDMYILINSDANMNELHDAYNQIRNEYSSILKEYGLALNAQKCCIKPTVEINEELKKSLYDEYYNGERHEIEEMFPEALQHFLKDLLVNIRTGYIDTSLYSELIEQHFSSPDIEFTPTEVFNHFVYENDGDLQRADIVSVVTQLINQDVSFISLDPKRLTVLIMKTKSSTAIKALLNQLFQRNRRGVWNSYDTAIAISYLIQSEFQHIDLLQVLGENSAALRSYNNYCCLNSFISVFRSKRFNAYTQIIGSDWKACFLYFMYWVEKERHNSLAEFAFFKSFFDRFTADLAFCTQYDPRCRKPNYNRFYKEAEHKRFYSSVAGCNSIIENAHRLRNENPLSHASAGLIDNSSTTDDLKHSIEEMFSLIDRYRALKPTDAAGCAVV